MNPPIPEGGMCFGDGEWVLPKAEPQEVQNRTDKVEILYAPEDFAKGGKIES